MFDDRPQWLESIDQMVDEKREEITAINNRFMVDGVCCCPLCKVLNRGEDNDRQNFLLRRSWKRKTTGSHSKSQPVHDVGKGNDRCPYLYSDQTSQT